MVVTHRKGNVQETPFVLRLSVLQSFSKYDTKMCEHKINHMTHINGSVEFTSGVQRVNRIIIIGKHDDMHTTVGSQP